MRNHVLATLVIATILLTGCGAPKDSGPAPQVSSPSQPPAKIVNITAADLEARLQAGEKLTIVDVRTPEEFAEGHIEGARLAPLQTVEVGVRELGLAKDQEIILVCRSGNRSAQAYQILAGLGYTNLRNMEGGMLAWEKLGAPIVR